MYIFYTHSYLSTLIYMSLFHYILFSYCSFFFSFAFIFSFISLFFLSFSLSQRFKYDALVRTRQITLSVMHAILDPVFRRDMESDATTGLRFIRRVVTAPVAPFFPPDLVCAFFTIYIYIYICIYLYIYISIYLYLNLYLSINIYISPYIYLSESIYLSIHLYISISLYPSLSIYISLSLSHPFLSSGVCRCAVRLCGDSD